MVERKVHWYSGSAGMIAALFGYGVSHWQVRCGTSRAPIGWTALSCHRLAKPAWLSSLVRNIEPTSMRSSIKARIAVEQSRDAPQLSTDRGAVLVPRALSCTVEVQGDLAKLVGEFKPFLLCPPLSGLDEQGSQQRFSARVAHFGTCSLTIKCPGPCRRAKSHCSRLSGNDPGAPQQEPWPDKGARSQDADEQVGVRLQASLQ